MGTGRNGKAESHSRTPLLLGLRNELDLWCPVFYSICWCTVLLMCLLLCNESDNKTSIIICPQRYCFYELCITSVVLYAKTEGCCQACDTWHTPDWHPSISCCRAPCSDMLPYVLFDNQSPAEPLQISTASRSCTQHATLWSNRSTIGHGQNWTELNIWESSHMRLNESC